MALDEVLPYYHPTRVVFVDDNESFLRSFPLQLPEDLAWLTFTSARECLDHVNSRPAGSLEDVCLSLHQRSAAGENDLLRMDLTLIEHEISNPERFSNISVIVADYDMPEMSGLEFLGSLEDSRIKKILLTGVADEKVAVQAFNEGLIDRFFQKNTPDIMKRLNATIVDMQRAYFRETSRVIQSALAMKSPDFFHDPAFVAIFEAIAHKHDIVEYYYVEPPRGILMVSDEGDLYRLVIFSEQDLENEIFRLRRNNAPREVLERITDGSHLPCLWTALEHAPEIEDLDWTSCLYPARRIRGNREWRYALIADPPADIEYDPKEASFVRFLERADIGHR